MEQLKKRRSGMSLILAAFSLAGALLVTYFNQSGALDDQTTIDLALIAIIGMGLAFALRKWLISEKTKAPTYRYLIRLAACMMFYIVALMACEFLIEDRGLSGWPAAILAFLPGLSFAGVIWIFGMLIAEEKDEFQRMMYVRSGLIATGFAFTCAAIWGFLETYDIVSAVPAFWWPTLWLAGVGIGAIFNKVKYGTWADSP